MFLDLKNDARHALKNKYSYVLILILALIVSRVILLMVGLEFDYSRANKFWQLLELSELKHNFLESMIYLHSQPPIFNMVTGILEKVAPNESGKLASYLFHVIGLAASIAMFNLLRLLGFTSVVSLCITLAYFLTPSVMLYEFWYFYTWLVSCLFIFSAYMLQLFVIKRRLVYVACFLILIAIICLTRSMYHLLYLTFVIFLLLGISKGQRLGVAALSLIALMSVGGWYSKNLIVFDFFGASSWGGMSVWKMVKEGHSESSAGGANNLSIIDEFSPISYYPEKYHRVPDKFKGIYVLTSEYKEHGATNFNHYGYISVSRDYMQMSIEYAKERPAAFLKKIIYAFGIYSKPSWEYFFLEPNRKKIQGYIDKLTMSDARFFIEEKVFGIKRYFDFPVSSLLVTPALMAMILVFAFKVLVSKQLTGVSSESIPLILFGVFTVFYTAFLGNLVEIGENNRFKFQTAPIVWVLFFMSIRWFARGKSSRSDTEK